jgi:hypothetical protein
VPYGHTPTLEGEWISGTRCLDPGAAFGGRPSALRYPECIAVRCSVAMTRHRRRSDGQAIPWLAQAHRFLSGLDDSGLDDAVQRARLGVAPDAG